ncbi:UNVERIFIED_CONTAM: NADPH-dependent diflavin oxidoreductase 1, partial [Siphonaria sp. JEL0065]
RGTLTILYGSETGTAEECALGLLREGRRRMFNCSVSALDSWERFELAEDSVAVLVFVVSTTGQGDEPRNMKKFWRFLLRKSLDGLMTNRVVAVFGLGDSSYPKFNYPAKKLNKRLLQLGATAIVPRGDGDDQHYLGVDGAFDPWCEQLWAALDERFPLSRNVDVLPKNVLPPSTYQVRFLGDGDEVKTGTPPLLKKATCVENTRITTVGHFQDVRHVVFDVDAADVRY